jgi:hypothetical protein
VQHGHRLALLQLVGRLLLHCLRLLLSRLVLGLLLLCLRQRARRPAAAAAGGLLGRMLDGPHPLGCTEFQQQLSLWQRPRDGRTV